MNREPSKPIYRPPVPLAESIRRAISRAKLNERRQLAEQVRSAVIRRRGNAST